MIDSCIVGTQKHPSFVQKAVQCSKCVRILYHEFVSNNSLKAFW